MVGNNKPPAARLFAVRGPLRLEFGADLREVEVAYETWGELNPAKDNAVLICPALSAHCHARSNPDDPNPGWWEQMIGPGLALDTERYFVICSSLLGGCSGTTGPLSPNPAGDAHYGADFPIVTIRDLVAIQVRLLDHLAIDKLTLAMGGSLGGMQALELGVRHPSRADRIITISATDRTRPYTAMFRHIGRKAILLDPAFKGGNYHDQQPAAGLRLARELGTIFYRSRRELNQRFTTTPQAEPADMAVDAINFDFQSYLDYQGRKAPRMFDANAYLRLSMAMDLHDIARGFAGHDEALSQIQAKFLVIGVEEDTLIPIDEQETLHRALVALGKDSTWEPLSSLYGHDAFLTEPSWFNRTFERFLSRS